MAFSSSGDLPLSRPSSGVVSPPQMKSRSRTQSLSSDRPSTLGHSLMSPPLSISPEAAFIAASAASQIVTNDHDGHAGSWYDQHGIEPSGEPALVSPAALQLVNNFLDQLLFNFLSAARSTSLTSLRPAVSEVLKPKLAKDAVNLADEELREYLGGGDDEELLQQGADSPGDWDLELVWKRTRLRCMVYSSLGDMEEEDEDYYMEQEHLDGDDDRQGATVSPAVAIFLTAILEFMGEQALVVAGQAAYHRMRSKYEKDVKEGSRSPVDVADRILVEELDMERVALDRTLGRLWRAWKKRIRSPIVDVHSFQRPKSRDSTRHFRQSSYGTESQVPVPELVEAPPKLRGNSKTRKSKTGEAEEPQEEYLRAAAIPLPLGDRDIAEILIPGIAEYSDDDDEPEAAATSSSRPRSLLIFPPSVLAHLPTPFASPHSPLLSPPRKRSNSLPAPSSSLYNPPPAKRTKVEPDAEQIGELSESPESTPPLDAPRKVASSKDAKRKKVAPISTAAAGPAAIATGSTFGSRGSSEGSDDENDDFADEGQFEILTSSRVSISGRSSSPAVSEQGRAISSNLPKRSSSVHSVRVIDMAGPRSPVSRSRGSSVEAQEHHPVSRAANLARNSSNSLSTSPIVEERPGDVPAGLRSAHATKTLRPHAGDAISEAEEAAESATTPTTESLSTPSEPRSAGRFEQLQAQLQTGNVMFGSVHRGGASPPQSPLSPVPPTTKITILSSTHAPGTYYDGPEVPSKSPIRSKPTSPTLPERSSSRQANVPQSPTTIGVISSGPGERNSPGRSRDQTAPRPTHTSGSSVSSHKFKPIRASEESASVRPVDVARNFEELIQSDQTIQYTLTPEGMRDIDASRANGMSEDRQNGDRSRSSSMNTPMDLKRSISISRKTGLGSHPVEVAPQPPSVPAKPRGPPAQAREARIPRESLADFAEFIRATGPAEEAAAAAAAAGRPGIPAAVRTASTPVGLPRAGADPNRQSTIARQRYQAREATADKDDNSDLIDFIRRGPPNANNPRIPRTVAPFRTTMDSDQLAATIGGRAVDARLPDIRYSGASTNITESSMNSSSALLKKDKSSPKFDDGGGEMMMPKRKTRRVKDPYALDFSDDEEEDEDAAPRGPRRAAPKEESLADFLKSYAPPEDNSPVPFNLAQSQAAAAAALPKKKASAPSLMARFTSRSERSPTKMMFGGSGNTSPRTADPPPLGSRTPSGGGAGRGYIPIQVNMPPGVDKYSPAAASSSSPLAAGGAAAPKGRVLMKKFEPREATSTSSRATSDLADFLRNSAPPGARA